MKKDNEAFKLSGKFSNTLKQLTLNKFAKERFLSETINQNTVEGKDKNVLYL